MKGWLRSKKVLFGTFCTWNHTCSDGGPEAEFTKKTLNQLKEKSPVRFRYTLRMHWAFFRPFRVGNIPLRGFTTRPSVSPVRCFKTFWFSTSNNGPFYFFNVLPEMELPWVASGTSNEHRIFTPTPKIRWPSTFSGDAPFLTHDALYGQDIVS